MTTVNPAYQDLIVVPGETRSFDVTVEVDAGFVATGSWRLHWQTDLANRTVDCQTYDQTTTPQLVASISGQQVTLTIDIPYQVTALLNETGRARYMVEQWQTGIDRRDAWLVGQVKSEYRGYAC